MATDVRRALSAPTPHARSGRDRFGLGSVFAKAVYDSRLAVVAVVGLLGSFLIVGGGTMATTYGTPETRAELAALSQNIPPVLRGLYGNPVNVATLGGFLSWHYGAYFALLGGLWSILVMSSTLAGEARNGSLDLVVATPRSRRLIAFEKVAGHVTALGVAMVLVALVAWTSGAVLGRLAGDEISPSAAIAFAIGIGFRALIAGGIAFAIAPLLGRSAAAAIAGGFMVAGFVIYSYRTVVPAFGSLAEASWFSWTADHLPLAGSTDWPAVGFVALVCAALFAVGVEAFARRDVGVTVSIPAPGMPAALLGLGGPLRRSFGDLLPSALAWGLGLGLYGIVMAASSRSMIEAISASPGLLAAVRNFVPGTDITTTAGFLQFAFADLGFVLIGLAAATLVAVRSSDETAGRLEIQLTTPLTRARWAAATGAAVCLALVVVTIVLGASIAVGVATSGADPVQPAAATLVLAVYGAALVGIGVAVAGLFGPSLAVTAVVAVAIGTFLIDVFAPALRLPDWVGQLALTEHLGQPMVGSWDTPGVLVCLAIAIGGLAVGAWGMARRDIAG